jgi:hypothetical protein
VKRDGSSLFSIVEGRELTLTLLSHYLSTISFVLFWCCDAHWTLLIVWRYISNSWTIYFFSDSIAQGLDWWFHAWKTLFNDDELFSGEWIKVKIFQQTEWERGARVCLHGVCFALSMKKGTDIFNDLSRFKDLSVHSHLIMLHICKDGYWTDQK